MSDFPLDSLSLPTQIALDFHREHQLVNLMIRGCIEHRWSLSQEERDIAVAMVYNAFEAYAVERGMPLTRAEQFCEEHLELLIQQIQSCL